MSEWVRVCLCDEIEEEDLVRLDHGGHTYVVYHTADGFFATDGLCTHEQQHLDDGLVIGNVIECSLHQGRFDIRTGKALSAPVTVDLKTYPVKVEDDTVYIQV